MNFFKRTGGKLALVALYTALTGLVVSAAPTSASVSSGNPMTASQTVIHVDVERVKFYGSTEELARDSDLVVRVNRNLPAPR